MYDLVWPLASPHKMWWGGNAVLNPRSFAAKDFVFLRTEKFKGIECYVLGLKDGSERWSIGVADHLLHRVEKGGFLGPDRWKLYAGEAKKRGADVRSDYMLEEWLGKLPKEEQKEIRSSAEHEARWKAHAWIDHWFMDYVELRPGEWFPKTQGFAYFDPERFDGGAWVSDYVNPIELFRHEVKVTDVKVDEKQEDSRFTVVVPEGEDVREE